MLAIYEMTGDSPNARIVSSAAKRTPVSPRGSEARKTRRALSIFYQATRMLPTQSDAWRMSAFLEKKLGRPGHALDTLLEGLIKRCADEDLARVLAARARGSLGLRNTCGCGSKAVSVKSFSARSELCVCATETVGNRSILKRAKFALHDPHQKIFPNHEDHPWTGTHSTQACTNGAKS